MTLLWSCEAFAGPLDVINAPGGCPFDPVADDIQAWIDMASDIMFQLTGGRVHGECTAIVYPMTDHNCFDVYGIRRSSSYWTDGWLGGTIIHTGPELADRFGGRRPVRLAGPNTTVIDVVIDGVTLAASEYILVNGVYLIRRAGSWPTLNDITQVSGTGTWTIHYTWGDPISLLMRDACVELAIDLAKASGVGAASGFGAGVVAANVQGVQLTIEELVQQYSDGRQNVPTLDRFVGIYGRGPTPDVYSPELDAYQLLSVHF